MAQKWVVEDILPKDSVILQTKQIINLSEVKTEDDFGVNRSGATTVAL